jgi:hypothetical protein
MRNTWDLPLCRKRLRIACVHVEEWGRLAFNAARLARESPCRWSGVGHFFTLPLHARDIKATLGRIPLAL